MGSASKVPEKRFGSAATWALLTPSLGMKAPRWRPKSAAKKSGPSVKEVQLQWKHSNRAQRFLHYVWCDFNTTCVDFY